MEQLQRSMVWALQNEQALHGPGGVNVRAFVEHMHKKFTKGHNRNPFGTLWRACDVSRSCDERVAMLDAFVYGLTQQSASDSGLSQPEHDTDIHVAVSVLSLAIELITDLPAKVPSDFGCPEYCLMHLVHTMYCELGVCMVKVNDALINCQCDESISNFLRMMVKHNCGLPTNRLARTILPLLDMIELNKPWDCPTAKLSVVGTTALYTMKQNTVIAAPPSLISLQENINLPAFLIAALWKYLSCPGHQCNQYLCIMRQCRPTTVLAHHMLGPYINLSVDEAAKQEINMAEAQSDPCTLLSTTLPNPLQVYKQYTSIPRVMLRKNNDMYTPDGTEVTKLPPDFNGTVRLLNTKSWKPFTDINLHNKFIINQNPEQLKKCCAAEQISEDLRHEIIHNALHVLQASSNPEMAIPALFGLAKDVGILYCVQPCVSEQLVEHVLDTSKLSADESSRLSKEIVQMIRTACVDNFECLHEQLSQMAQKPCSPSDLLTLAQEQLLYAERGRQAVGILSLQLAALFDAEPVSWWGQST